MTKTIKNINQLVLSVLLTIGAIGGIESAAAGAGNPGAAAAAAMGWVNIEVWNPLNSERVKFKANNVDPRTPLRQIHWVPDDPTESPLEPWDEFARIDILLHPQPLDSSQSISQLGLDTNIGPDNVIRINVLRLTKAGRALKTENPLRGSIDRMSAWWNSQTEGERQMHLQWLQNLIDDNIGCLPDMEPMNKLREVCEGACNPDGRPKKLTREHFEDWLGYMETEQPKALEFLMRHKVYNQLPPRNNKPMFDLFTSVFRVLKSMNPMNREITVVHPNSTESKMTINLNRPLTGILPWATELRLHGNRQWPKGKPIGLDANLNLFNQKFDFNSPNTTLEIVDEASDPKKYVLDALKVARLYDQNLLQQLPVVKELVASKLASLKDLKDGASFHNSNYTGPEYNKILSTVMTCLIQLYDKLLDAKGNTRVAETNVGRWVDDMIKENPVLLSLMAYCSSAIDLCGNSAYGAGIIPIITNLADRYHAKTFLPGINHE